MKEMVGGCCVCSDERGWPDNPLVYCDGNGCTVAVHQACYGIIAVPTGPWFCRKCESPETKGKVRCELCPSKSGALKRTDTGGWAHVVCALYIPEVRFGNVTSMEPIVLRLIPPERYNKTCYICQDLGKTHRANAGACMQCNKSGCRQQFHVTCAQALGLLCEEAGNYLDNVKYCGYCQHHYSKLKKGGNVKTIPPYKPVSHDSQSSDSSGEKEGDASPMATGSGTPTHTAKSKGPGRKTSHSSSASSKGAPNSGKTPSHTPQTQDKKKPSPNRRGSSTGETGNGSKSNTPTPSPQHSTDTQGQKEIGGKSKTSTPAPSPQRTPEPVQEQTKASGSTTPGGTKVPAPAASPNAKPMEPVGVISSVASATATATAGTVSTITPPPTSASSATSVVQVATSKPTCYPESVITNTDAVETKQTKKRKAMSAANTPTPTDYTPTPPPQIAPPPSAVEKEPSTSATLIHQCDDRISSATPPLSETSTQNSSGSWDSGHTANEPHVDMEKVIKKAKMEGPDAIPAPMHFSSINQGPPPPAHSPASQPSPRHLPSPMPGPSGMNQMTNIRSPSHMQGAKDRDVPASLLVSVPLPSTSHGLHFTHHPQMAGPSDMGPGPSMMYHQAQKQAAMEQNVPGHSPLMPGRSTWPGLNVAYEMQDPSKSGIPVTGKDPMGTNLSQMPAVHRNKKRAIAHTATSVVAMSNPPPQTTLQAAVQNLANVRRPPLPTPPPMYHEPNIKESPPSSPGLDRPLKPKFENNAPHMLGNELNPESGAAARLQEQLSAELAAHAAGTGGPEPLVPPPLINKAAPMAGSSSGRSGSSAQSLDQLLERQWEQGSQFLMEQAQHFDIASLLSCLHQLRTENVRLEEHVGNLLQRRDHLLAVNARLAIPLTAVTPGPPEPPRCPREGTSQVRPPPPPPVRAPESMNAERQHQLIMREVQQKPPS
ncbi:protein AF-10 isoform X3 [Zerene cesonia]|uniref:protein AF-10 isoform X3 n=1 Tax=Zerene cesonia TaxID=33412 RepID=UPI0018E5236B|nr:protein AF-10 isoform X3 [Zerene cesonia]